MCRIQNIEGTWVITSGLNNGAARLIGIGIDRLRALTNTNKPITLIGISWWGNVAERTRKMVAKLQNGVSIFIVVLYKRKLWLTFTGFGTK